MPTVVGANVIERGGAILVVQEGKAEVDGQWNLPSGRMEAGETPVACARREAREEIGLEVTPDALVGVYLDRSPVVEGDVLVFVFHSLLEGGSPRVPEGDSVVDCAWVTPENLDDLDVREAYVIRAVADFLDGQACDAGLITDLAGREPRT